MTDDPCLMWDPGWKPQRVWLHLDWIEDGCIRTLAGMSILTALRSEPFGDGYYASHMLLAIARIRRARKAGKVEDAICGAIELGEMLAEQTAYTDIRWALGERRLRVRGNAVRAAWGTPEERKAKKDRVRALFRDAMNGGAKTQEQAYHIVADEIGTTPRTVRRIITGH
jgi:hypothetical protein